MPYSEPFPPITNPFTFRLSAALPAAGAWDASPLIVACPQYARIVLYLSYTRGAAGGAFDFQLQVSPYSSNLPIVQSWFNQSEYSPAVLAAGVDSQSRLQQEYITYASQAAAIENVVYGPVELGAGVERIMVKARESGIIATPGTLHIVGIVYNERA
jgi:hypothetical protein